MIVIKTASYKMQKEAAVMQSIRDAIKKYGPKLVTTALVALGVAGGAHLVNQAINVPYNMQGQGLLQWNPMETMRPEDRKNYDILMKELKPIADDIKSHNLGSHGNKK